MANTCFSLKAGAVDLGLAWVRHGFNHRRGLFGLVFMRRGEEKIFVMGIRC